jgi:hypothetical protein
MPIYFDFDSEDEWENLEKFEHYSNEITDKVISKRLFSEQKNNLILILNEIK